METTTNTSKINKNFARAGLMSLVMLYSTALISQPAGSNCERAIFLPPPAETCSQSTEHMPPKENRRFFKFTSYSTAIEITVSKVLSGPDAEITKISALEGVCNNLNLLKQTQQIINGKLTLKLEGLTPGQVCFIKAERVKVAQGNFEMCVKEVEEPLPFGLPNTALGNAIITEVGTTLEVTNIGNGGGDGLSVKVNESNFHVELETSSSLPIGARMITEGFGQVDGVPNKPTLNVVAEQVANGTQITPDFNAMGAGKYRLDLFFDNAIIYSQSGMTGAAGVIIPDSPLPAKLRPRCCMHKLSYSIPFGIKKKKKLVVSNGPTIETDMMVMTAESPTKTVDFVSDVNIRAKSVSQFTITQEWVLMFDKPSEGIPVGIPHRSLGDANLTPADGNITVSNIGAGGSNGVQINFVEQLVLGKEVVDFTYDIELTDVPTLPAGAFWSSSTTAQVDGVKDQPAGNMVTKRVPSGFEVTPDFSAIGASTYGLQLFKNGSLIFSKSGMSGPAYIEQANNGANPPDKTTTTKIKCTVFAIGVHYSKVSSDKKRIKVTGGPTLLADEIIFSSENATKQIDFVSSIDILAKDVDFFTLTDESTEIPNLAKMAPDNIASEEDNMDILLAKEAGLIWEIYPNPFSHSATINFSVAESGQTTLDMYNVTGILVSTLFSEIAEKGAVYTVKFYVDNSMPNGLYFYKLTTGNKLLTKKVLKTGNIQNK